MVVGLDVKWMYNGLVGVDVGFLVVINVVGE